MSNVLIGIIGVILFIGLALAGALFLGDRFTETRNSSVGAATVQAVSQIANAMNYENADRAIRSSAGYDPATLVSGGYLKAVPANPSGGPAISVLGGQGEPSVAYASLVVAQLPEGNDRLCGAVVRQTATGLDITGTGFVPVAASAGEIPQGPAGCFQVGSGSIGGLEANRLYVFARL